MARLDRRPASAVPSRKPMGGRSPAEIARENLDFAVESLAGAGIDYVVVRTNDHCRHVLAVWAEHRAAALEAIASRAEPGQYFRVLGSSPGDLRPLSELTLAFDDLASEEMGVVRMASFYSTGDFNVGFDRACDLEFWARDDTYPNARVAPRNNVAAGVIEETYLAPAPVTIGDKTYVTASVFTQKFIEDIDFPVDVVYSWVDGSDPAWLASKERARAGRHTGETVEPHEYADAEVRFRSRDELRYSLRSLHMFAPWVRNIYLITDQQVPDWLDVDRGRVTVLDHADLFDGATLPTFNSNVIASFLHKIDGLSEQFVYFNDDVLLGKAVNPGKFFTPAGQARVFLSATRRPFVGATTDLEPHIASAVEMRRLLEEKYGRTLSRATPHVPIPLIRSKLAELEATFSHEFSLTRDRQFRHGNDLPADLLFQHVALIEGFGVASDLDFKYVNLGKSEQEPGLWELLRRRHKESFCLNDAMAPGHDPIESDRVFEFLEAYFPVPSPFERP